jgi:diguanylate cyclase (GGDEF)-like protein
MAQDLSKFNRLPSLPTVAVRLLEQFADPNFRLAAVADVIKSDPATCSRILKAASSIQFGVGTPITDLQRAIALLGRKQVTSLALCFSLTQESMQSGPVAALYRSFWLQSVLQATTAGELARRFSPSMEGEMFIAALLADIGRLAMLKASPLEYVAAYEAQGKSANSAGRSIGHDVAELSCALMRHWNLPDRLVRANEQRNWSVQQLLDNEESDCRDLACAVAFATAAGSYFCDAQKGIALVRLTELATELFGLTDAVLQEFLSTVQNRVQDLSELFKTDASVLGSPYEIMSDAMEELSRLANSINEGSASADVCTQLVDENGHLKQRIQDLVRRSTVDSLTGVYNRGQFDNELSARFAEAQAAKQPIGLLFIDADHFKSINDTYGHSAGDEVLRHTATIISRSLRNRDVVARYGGEEFVVVVSNPSLAALESLGERIRSAVEQERISTNGGVVRVTVSIGGALFEPPYPADGSASLVQDADAAVYTAKASGRNCVEIRRRAAGSTWSSAVHRYAPELVNIAGEEAV